MKTTAYSGRVTNWPLCWVVVAVAAGLAVFFAIAPELRWGCSSARCW